jgi:NAD(P)-dependent dehydrogenase (short-subunit alcohol dehydrogenase family)
MKTKMLEGKTAIVTGGSKGIGQGIAELYAQEGANVVITARGKNDLDAEVEKITRAGGKATGIVADQRNPESVNNVFQTTLATYGDFDILVINAGVGENIKIEATPNELFDEIYEINMKGPFMYAREAVKHFLPKKDGSIIMISSVNGIRPLCGVSYCTSKGALNMMAKQIAMNLVGTGVRINTICPGYTITPLSGKQERTNGGAIPTAGTDYDPMNLDDRMNPPEDVSTRPILLSRSVRGLPTYPIDQAYAALFFGSDMSKCVNGQIISVDNGSYL